MRKLHLRPIIVVFLGVITAWSGVSADWPIKSFQVIAREPSVQELQKAQPDDIGDSVATALGLDHNLDPNAGREEIYVKEAADWLEEISTSYEQSGHKPAALGPVIKVGDVDTFRAYIFPFEGSRTRDGSYAGATYTANTCQKNGRIPWMSLNDSNEKPGESLPPGHFHGFAHEMMHAIEYGSPLTYECTHDPQWVTEGMANGAAALLTNEKFPREISHRDRSSSAVGLRDYSVPLTHNTGNTNKSIDDRMSYGAGSLWQFIGELFGGLSVYPHFLDKVLIENMNAAAQMKWLDEALQTLPGLKKVLSPSGRRGRTNAKDIPGVYEVFPAFLTEFASYGGARYMAFAGKRFSEGRFGTQEARDVWLDAAFGGCEEIVLSPDVMNDEIPFSMFKNAAICLNIRYEGFSGNITSRIEIISENLMNMDQFHLGWAWKIGPDKTENCYEERKRLNLKWTPCVYKTFSQLFPPSNAYTRTWPEEMIDFGTGGKKSAERILILSNVAVQPWLTKMTQTLTLKVAITGGTYNGKPAEPMPQYQVPRDRKRPVSPGAPRDKKSFYGLETDPPLPDGGIKALRLGPYTPNRSKGAKALPGGYGVNINNLKYGQTGPIHGIVTWDPPDPGSARGVISSSFCKDSAKPIGEVVKSDEDALRITIDVDLCEAGPGTLKQCENGCPVVDHVTADMNTAFGWRQFSETAPTDIITPGIQRYINTMPESVQEMMNSFSDTALPGFGGGTGTSGGGKDGDAGGTGAGEHSGGALPACACTCDEKEATEAEAQAWKRRVEAGQDPSMRDISELMRCSSACQSEYAICAMEAGEAKKREKERLAREREEAVACDCSCEAIDKSTERAREMEKQFMAGGSVSNEDLFQLTQCASVCQQEMLSCAMKKMKK